MTIDLQSQTLRRQNTSTNFWKWDDPDLTDGNGAVYIGTQPNKIEENKWMLSGENKELTRELGRYLGTPSILPKQKHKSKRVRESLDRRTQARLIREDRRLFLVSMQAIVRILAETALEVAFPQKDQGYESRMNRPYSVPQVDDESEVVLLKISRGGDTPTHYASKHLEDILLNPPQILQASSQRKQRRKKGEKPKVIYEIKGRTNLTGKILLVFEQAHASAETVVNVIPAVLKKCKSKPDHIVICCINSCEYAVRATFKVIPDAIIINACLHNALTPKWYLDFIGCGDCGAEEHRVAD